ncbi:DUF1223 domain-containing protein [Rhodosalinus sp.]|uniref:DUF1223 domain-containing protein n=1 Tax=Rhodosalinus sp. TaxID=2047741 RepID=UPI003979DF46
MTGIARGLGTLLLTLIATAAWTTERGVVVELFTSQGCSACPPADELLADLAEREGVIALALHVDYWDYIGWKDSFAQPRFTQRQKAYARANHDRSVFTPQIIVGGQDRVMGAKAMKVMDLIAAHAQTPQPVSLSLVRDEGRLTVALSAERAMGPADVQLVRYRPSSNVHIKRGENAGRTFDYANVVTDWKVLGRWDGQAPLRLRVEAEGDSPVVVIVQEAGHGRVLAAARLR